MSVITNRAVSALKRRHNWVQLGQFGIVGASGYAINLGVYTLLLGIGAHAAAAVSFVVSAANNYWWNRHWTFAHAKGHFGYQGMRFFAVSAAAFEGPRDLVDSMVDWCRRGPAGARVDGIEVVWLEPAGASDFEIRW